MGNGTLGKDGGNEILVGKKERDGNSGYNGSRNIQPRTMPVDGRIWTKAETNPKGEIDANLEIIRKRLRPRTNYK